MADCSIFGYGGRTTHPENRRKDYNYFRNYDSQTSRYIESDPIGLAGGINTYVYALGDPISNIDADGLNVVTKGVKWIYKGAKRVGWIPTGTMSAKIGILLRKAKILCKPNT